MSPKVTLGLLLVLALLAGTVFALERFNIAPPAASETPEPEEIQVLEFDDRQVTSLSLRLDEQTLRFHRVDETTWQIADSGEPADRVSITSVLIAMGQLEGTKRVEEAPTDDLSEFGLDAPRYEARAEMEDGTTYTLLIGNRTPVGSNMYAKTGDSGDVFVIANTLATNIERLVQSPQAPPTSTPRPTLTPPTEPSPEPDASSTPGS